MLFLLGFGAVGWGGLMGTLAGETGGQRAAGAAAGVSAAFFNVGIFLGPPLFGLIVDRTGSYTPAWWALAASAAVALVLLLFVREGRDRLLRCRGGSGRRARLPGRPPTRG